MIQESDDERKLVVFRRNPLQFWLKHLFPAFAASYDFLVDCESRVMYCRAAFHPHLASSDERLFYERDICLGHDGCLLNPVDQEVIIPVWPPDGNDGNIDKIDYFHGFWPSGEGPICELVNSGVDVPACCMISLTKPFGIVQRRICTVQRLFRARRLQRRYSDNMIKFGVFMATYWRDQRCQHLS